VDTRIKERLTGALILVAALVILVPEIFSGRHVGAPAREAPPAAPASEGPPLRTYTAELAAPDSRPAASAPAPAPTPPPVVPAQPPPAALPVPVPAKPPASVPPAAQARPQDKPVHEEKPVARESKPAAPTPTPSAGGDWFVQVGSFSQPENAERYAQQLRKQGFGAIVLPPAGAKGLSRVRVGPARTREAAGALLEKLAAAGHKGAVVGP